MWTEVASAPMLVASVQQAQVARLQDKQYRATSDVLGMMPDGTGSLGQIQDRAAFADGSDDEEGDEAWYRHVASATAPFTKGTRSKTTAKEHELYMKNISEWVRSMGFPPLVERAEMEDQNRFGGIKPVMMDGCLRRIRPEMIVSMLSLMSVGDPRAPKNMRLTQRLKRDQASIAHAANSYTRMYFSK